jgi:predicted DNA-binding transcriptional regulator YafY
MTKSRAAAPQLVRAVRMLRRLQGRARGVRLDDLAAEHDVSRSQIRRDLLALEEAGIDLAFDTEEGRYGRARVRLVDADRAHIALTRRERWTLLAARRVFDVFRGTALYEDITCVFDKLVETLPARERSDLRALAERVIYLPAGGIKDLGAAADIVDALQDGVMQQRHVRYRYKPRFGPASEGELEPYAFVLYRNGLYVVASRRLPGGDRQPPRVFAVERFTEAEPIRRSRFDRPADLEVAALFDGAFGIIGGSRPRRVVIDLGRAASIEAERRRWHHSQTVEPLAGGRVRLAFEVTDLREVVSWVLGWGPQAIVREPPELRHRVRTALADALAAYAD